MPFANIDMAPDSVAALAMLQLQQMFLLDLPRVRSAIHAFDNFCFTIISIQTQTDVTLVSGIERYQTTSASSLLKMKGSQANLQLLSFR